MFWTPCFQQSTQRWNEYRRLPRATIVTAGFIVNQPTPSFSNSFSVSTYPSLLRFCSKSELFPRRPGSSLISDHLLLVNSCSVSTSPSLPPKLSSVCFLGLPRFLFTTTLFSETVLCNHVRQIDVRLFRHSMRPRTFFHFHTIRANYGARRSRVI